MNTALTSPTALITHVDGSEIPAPGRWSVAPGHSWPILRTRLGPLAGEASAFGPALAGTVDVDFVPENCRMSLAIDARRLTSDHPAMDRGLADRHLWIEAARSSRFAPGGWDITGSVVGGDETADFAAWMDYRGVYRRARDFAYAWFTMELDVPAAVLGIAAGSIRRRHLSIYLDVLATADSAATSAA